MKEDSNNKNSPERQIIINLEEHENKKHYNVIYDTNSFVYKNGIPLELLKIQNFLDKLDIEYGNAIRKGKKFIGWINIIIHEEYRKSILEKRKEINHNLKKILNEKKYKVIIVFKFQWNFNKQNNIILEF